MEVEGGPAAPAPRRSLVRVAGPLLVAAVLGFAVLLLRSRLSSVGGVGGLPGPGATALVVAANVLGNVLLIAAWRRLVAAAGTRLPLAAAARVWTVSQLARYTIGAAQVASRAVAGRRLGVSAAAGTLTTLVEIAWGVSLTAAVVLATAPAWLPDAPGLGWAALLAVVPTAVVLAGLVSPRRVLGALAAALDGSPLRRLTGGRAAPALREVRVDRRLAAEVTAAYAVVIALRVAATAVLVAAVDGSGDGVEIGIGRIAGAWALGQVVGQLAVFAPGGLGPREGATALVLAPALGAEAALLVVALIRLGELAAELASFGLARLLPGRRGPG